MGKTNFVVNQKTGKVYRRVKTESGSSSLRLASEATADRVRAEFLKANKKTKAWADRHWGKGLQNRARKSPRKTIAKTTGRKRRSSKKSKTRSSKKVSKPKFHKA